MIWGMNWENFEELTNTKFITSDYSLLFVSDRSKNYWGGLFIYAKNIIADGITRYYISSVADSSYFIFNPDGSYTKNFSFTMKLWGIKL
jgi:hypothetical protein